MTLNAPIDKVQVVLSRALKPGRKLLTAVRYVDGTVEEAHAAVVVPTPPPPKEPKPRKKKAAVTVAQPHKGCPVPEFERAEFKATRVLEAFLSPKQLADYQKYQMFVTVGADTGRRYLVKSRHQPDVGLLPAVFGGGTRRYFPGGTLGYFPWEGKDLARAAYCSVMNLDAQWADSKSGYAGNFVQPLCIHDWTVPAPEEMLAIHLCLSLPGQERHIVMLPEDHGNVV